MHSGRLVVVRPARRLAAGPGVFRVERPAVHRPQAERPEVLLVPKAEQLASQKVALRAQARPARLPGRVATVRLGARRHRAVALPHPAGRPATDRLAASPMAPVAVMARQLAAVNAAGLRPAVGLARRMDALRARRSAVCAPEALRPVVAEPVALDVQAAARVPAAGPPGVEVAQPAAPQGHALEEQPLAAEEPDEEVAVRSEPAEQCAVPEVAALDVVRRPAAGALGAVLRPARQDQDLAVHPVAGRAAVASACHRGRLRPAAPEPGPQPAALSVPAIRSLPLASLIGRLSQAAGDEVCSCDLGFPERCLFEVE